MQEFRWPLRIQRRDQLVLATVSLVLWLWLIASLLRQGIHRGELVDVDRARVAPVLFRLDVNQADWPELALLPGIGELRARRIVELRESRGPFQEHEQLLRVKGIGPKTLERIRPFLLPCRKPVRLVTPGERSDT